MSINNWWNVRRYRDIYLGIRNHVTAGDKFLRKESISFVKTVRLKVRHKIWWNTNRAWLQVYRDNIFSCDQVALRTPLSVCLSVCLSVTPFSLCSCHRIATKFSGVINNVHTKGQGQRSKVKVKEVMTQFSRFRTVTPVWIHIWW